MHLDLLLEQFEATLKNQVAELQAAASSAAPGGVGDWERIVAYFGLPTSLKKQRVQAAIQRQHRRGAFPEEFEAVTEALAQQAELLLNQIQLWHSATLASEPAARARVGSLLETVRGLAQNQRTAYEASITPKTGVAGLAGIFANASATASLTPWAHVTYDTQLTLSCPGCGSPQCTRLAFDCEFCGASLFGPKA